MDNILQGSSGKRYRIQTPALAKGGEGSIFKINGEAQIVAKIFDEKKRTFERTEKLIQMVTVTEQGRLKEFAAWPMDLLYGEKRIVGYVMRNLEEYQDLNQACSGGIPGITFFRKILIAQNLCAAVQSVHHAGQVCGDLNPSNILLHPSSGKLMLVDTDSYHIVSEDGKRIFRCEVGIPEYMSKEILDKLSDGKTLAEIPLPTYTVSSDRFALGIHIFSLLMNGCHPFACAARKGSEDETLPLIPESIKKGDFWFEKTDEKRTTPLYAPEYSILPSFMQEIFHRCFVEGSLEPEKRPSEEEWYTALEQVKKTLVKCKKDPNHIYPDSAAVCPWCQIEQRMNRMLGAEVQENEKAKEEQAEKKDVKQMNGTNAVHSSASSMSQQNRDYKEQHYKNYLSFVYLMLFTIIIFIVASFLAALSGF